MATPATGVLDTLTKYQPGPRGNYLLPVPVQFAGLGRDSLIFNGGAPPYAGLWPALSGGAHLLV